MSINETLNERGERYGDFKDVARITNSLFATCREGNQFHQLSESQNLALRMICIKMARIVNGDPNYIDNWHDIAGYATLAERACEVVETPRAILEAEKKLCHHHWVDGLDGGTMICAHKCGAWK